MAAREPFNRLLSRLQGEDFHPLMSRLEDVTLKVKQVVHEPDERIRHVYFPTNALISLVAVMRDGGSVETGMVGYEGMVGIPLTLGATEAHTRAFCQIPGAAKRLPAAFFVERVERLPELRHLLHGYVRCRMVQLTQGVACNSLHSVEQRCARWLLATRDRVPGDSFPLTQEFWANMLAVRRASVTEVAGKLQKAGLISYQHGKVTIRDRKRLEAAACECYRVIADEFDRLFQSNGSTARNPTR
jgi:CRP-like cAMP-binding protein